MNVKSLINGSVRRFQSIWVPVVRPEIIRVFDHDPQAFTQGLEYAEGALYESTGKWGASSLRRLSLESGAVLERVPVENDFAEGIAYTRGYIFQLTWTSGRVLVYEPNPLHLVGERRIEHEGWGLASYRGGLVATDGSHIIRHFDLDLRVTSEIALRRLGLAFRHLNALEVVQDQGYINIWYSMLIAQVDLTRSRLVRLIDCAALEEIESPQNPHHVLNGIAYIPERESFIVTGKHWRRMFEIRLDSR